VFFLGTVYNKDFIVDEHMALNVQMYLDEVRHHATGGELLVEQRLDFSEWVPEGFGTGDAIVLNGSEIQVIDLKYGRGVRVEADGNEQLMLYALGAYHTFSALDDFENVTVRILQPRLSHASAWTISVKHLLEFAELATAAAQETQKPDAKCIAGEKQCLWCRAKATCVAAAKEVAKTIEADFEDLTSDAEPTARDTANIDNKHLGAMYSKLEFIEGWCKSFRAHVYEALEQGESIPGYKMVAGRRGDRAWSSEELATEVMKSMRLKIDEMYAKKLISPAQAEKLLKGKKKKWDRVSELITQSDGKPTIAPEGDKRPAIGGTVDDFVDLTE
jgi:hypothetical protein